MKLDYKILVINPGSTSTKISLFRNTENLFTESVFHEASVLLAFPTVNDQVEFRKNVILGFLERHGYKPEDIDVFIGRGGGAYSQKSGVLEIDSRLYQDTKDEVSGSDHPSKLGVMLAWDFSQSSGKPAYTVDAINVDEFDDVARITGISGVYRKAQTHALNQKATARIHAEKIGKKYEDCNFIVSHIDGGVTVTAHSKGRMIDTFDGSAGDGPFSPTRIGEMSVLNTLEAIEKLSADKLRKMCSRAGGFVSHFGTSDAAKVHALVEKKDEHARLVWEAMCYQISKCIGDMACVLKGKVDAIILTGGLVRYRDIVDYIRDRCEWIAPVAVYPGEVEQEAMALHAYNVITGKEKAEKYTGKPVFTGFEWDKNLDKN